MCFAGHGYFSKVLIFNNAPQSPFRATDWIIPLLRGVRGVFFYSLLNNTQRAWHISFYI